MDKPISERPLTEVNLNNLDLQLVAEDEWLLTATCFFSIEASDGRPRGPAANVFFGIPMDLGMSFRDGERALLTRAHEILARLASFSVEELESQFAQKRANDLDDRETLPHIHTDQT